MSQELALAVDTVSCVGCFSCEVACKQEHDLPVGPKFTAVIEDPIRVIEGRRQLRYTVTHCMHCHEAKCKEACPEDAISKRADGIVLINAKICNGCRMCMEACPFGVIQFEEAGGFAFKCDLCVNRIDQGKAPACVGACLSHCIHYGPVDQVVKQVSHSRLLLWYKEAA